MRMEKGRYAEGVSETGTVGGREGEGEGEVRPRKTVRSRPSDNANHFPLKLPFAPGQSSVSKAIYPAERCATYTYPREFNGPAKKGSGLVTFPG